MNKSDRVYLLGVGLNKAINNSRDPNLSPPLINDLFKVASKLGKFADYDQLLFPLYKYIMKYWRKNKSSLRKCDFSLEECFTLIQMQLTDARSSSDTKLVQELLRVQYLLIGYFTEIMSEFKPYCEISNMMMEFGRILYDEKPTIITFNYDTFVESVIEKASGISYAPNFSNKFQSNVAPEKIGDIISSHQWKWNRPLAYGIYFDKIQIHDGAIGNRKKFFEANEFYSHKNNTLYPWSILKLHGSLNWWQYVDATPNQFISDRRLKRLYESKKEKIVLQDLHVSLPISFVPWNEDQLYVEPIIITPVLYKQYDSEEFLYRKVFDPLWKKAKVALRKCKSIVVIGYSFSIADFRARQLLIEAFSENIADELIIVNPSNIAINETKRLIQFKTVRHYSNLECFIKNEK